MENNKYGRIEEEFYPKKGYTVQSQTVYLIMFCSFLLIFFGPKKLKGLIVLIFIISASVFFYPIWKEAEVSSVTLDGKGNTIIENKEGRIIIPPPGAVRQK